MFVALVLMYFLLACFACWLLLFPGGRAIVLHAMVNLGWRVRRRARHLKGGGSASHSSAVCAGILHRRKHACAASMALPAACRAAAQHLSFVNKVARHCCQHGLRPPGCAAASFLPCDLTLGSSCCDESGIS